MRSALLLLTVFTATVLAGMIFGVVWTHGRLQVRDTTIRTLLSEIDRVRAEEAVFEQERTVLLVQVDAVERERDAALSEIDRLRSNLAAVQTRMQETMVPREVGSAADFPIERAMARDGDTLQTFAEREGTSPAVLKALNPWLDETRRLRPYQALWVPRKARSPGG